MTDKTLRKGLQLLEMLATRPELDGIAKLARALEWSKSNVHRTLQTLVGCGYAAVHEGRYTATLRLWTVGSLVHGRLDLKSMAAPSLAAIAEGSRESAHLSILDGAEVIYIDKIESPQPVRAYSQVGGRAPAHAVATGKALLAYLPDETVRHVAQQLHAYTASTITDPDLLLAHLEEVRATGIAINRGEWRDQVWGIAAPVIDAEGRVVAAIGVSGPAGRFTAEAFARFVPLVRDAARQTSARLGHVAARHDARSEAA
ncbi:IclR family transcriptional regulator [Muricoccus roseus]|jgi:IclR family transcriptional regulator, KDG regulon repressor|nr:IclR family transcriptional regulator [Roseomonas rosea]